MSGIELSIRYTWNEKMNTISKFVMRGLTDTLSAAFYPCYKYNKAVKGSYCKLLRDKTLEKSSKITGKKLGKALDGEICHYVKTGHIDSIKSLPHTRVVLKEMKRLNYRFVHAQLPVCDSTLRLCTRLDIVAWDGLNYCLIELKTGYERYKFKHTGENMNFPLEDVEDSPHNQHMLQLVCNEMLFKTTYNDISNVRSLLWYVSGSDIIEFTINSGWVEKIGAIRKELLLTKAENKKDRQKHRKTANLKASLKRKRCYEDSLRKKWLLSLNRNKIDKASQTDV